MTGTFPAPFAPSVPILESKSIILLLFVVELLILCDDYLKCKISSPFTQTD